MPEATTPVTLDALGRLAQSAAFYDAGLRGFVAQSGPPWGNVQAAPASLSEIATKIYLPPGGTKINGSVVNIGTVGVTLTAAQNLVTLYNSLGVKIGQSADQSGNWTGLANIAADFVGGPFTLTDPFCYVSILSNGTTPAAFRMVNGNAAWANVGGPLGFLTGANLFCGRIGAAVTAPASFNPANLVQTGSALYWIGLY